MGGTWCHLAIISDQPQRANSVARLKAEPRRIVGAPPNRGVAESASSRQKGGGFDALLHSIVVAAHVRRNPPKNPSTPSSLAQNEVGERLTDGPDPCRPLRVWASRLFVWLLAPV
jgi:hypothetical protein